MLKFQKVHPRVVLGSILIGQLAVFEKFFFAIVFSKSDISMKKNVKKNSDFLKSRARERQKEC